VSYQSEERKRLVEYARKTWNVEGHVLPYEVATETLHESVRASALAYFDEHEITWWTSRWDVGRPAPGGEEVGVPTGHLNSSQVACVNHLEPARLDRELALRVAANVDPALVDVRPVEDGGFVAYEWIGLDSYLGEPGARVRGANITSLDALMCGERADGTRVLLVVEWKYLERYGPESLATSKHGTDRVAIYRRLLDDPDCPIKAGDHARVFYEPYDQLMRQTLLAWQMVVRGEHGASEWLHVHVVPQRNAALRGGGRGARTLVGATLHEKWCSVLKEPRRYLLLTPTELLEGVDGGERWGEWRSWLHDRYGT
jgi:hypothetical protein